MLKLRPIFRIRKALRRYEVAYLCDRKACNVHNPDCSHTLDIRHAVNFEKLDDEHYMEIADISHLITK